MIRQIILSTAACLMPVGFAAAQMGAPPEAAGPFIPDVDVESWIYQFPAKWQPYSSASETKQTTVAFPYGQKPTKWKVSLNFETFLGTMGATDASQLYDLKVNAATTQCADHTAEKMGGRAENGYSTAMWTLRCELANGDILFTMNKATLGNEKLYLATKTWKTEPKGQDIEKWQRYFRGVYVCDPRTGENPCEPPAGGGRGGPPQGRS